MKRRQAETFPRRNCFARKMVIDIIAGTGHVRIGYAMEQITEASGGCEPPGGWASEGCEPPGGWASGGCEPPGGWASGGVNPPVALPGSSHPRSPVLSRAADA